MTRKDYTMLANVFASELKAMPKRDKDLDVQRTQVWRLVDRFMQVALDDNPRFSRVVFTEAVLDAAK